MVLGGETIHRLLRIIRYADGWLSRARNVDPVVDGIATLDQLAIEAGRDLASISISALVPPPKD